MIISKSRELDRKRRLDLLEVLQIALRSYQKTNNPSFLELAKYFGGQSERIKIKMANYGYKTEDAFEDMLDRVSYQHKLLSQKKEA